MEGTGTPADPYIIDGLQINASAAHGIRVENTNVSFLIREVEVHSGGERYDGVSLHNVTSGRVERTLVSISRNGIVASHSEAISLSANDLRSNLENGIHILHSTDVVVENNTLTHNQRIGVWVEESADVAITGNVASSVRRFDSSHFWFDAAIYLQFATGVLVRNNIIESFEGEGVDIGGSRDVHVVGNILRSNGRSISSSLSNNVTVAENAIIDNGKGLQFWRSPGARVLGNNVSNNGWDGISLSFSPGAIVKDNVLVSNAFAAIEIRTPFVVVENNTIRSNGPAGGSGGISLSFATNATLKGNRLTSDGLIFWGNEMAHITSHDIDTSNLVNGAPLHYHRDCSGLTLDGVPVGQLVVANCTDVRVSELQITGTAFPIRMAYVEDVRLENSVIYANRGPGVELKQVRNATIVGNTIALNEMRGIGLLSSSQITIAGNNVTYNGGRLGGPAFGEPGIGLQFTSDTLVYRNNVINNTKQAEVVVGMEDVWDNGYPSGGNFWSDYSGEDLCSGAGQDTCPDPDGLGDTPYALDFGAADRYPLAKPAGPSNTPPHAVLQISPLVGGPTIRFSLNASNSSDAEDLPGMLAYRWDWEGDGEWDTGYSTEPVVRHGFSVPGNHSIRLEVRDSRGATNITDRNLTVLNEPPVVRFNVHRETGDTTTTFRFDASPTFDYGDPGPALRVRWDWQNDGVWDTPLTVTKSAAHRFAEPGMHIVRVQAVDTADLASERTRSLLVLTDQPPIAAFGVSPSIGDNTTTFSVDASDSFDWGNLSAPLQFRWDWEGDGLWDTPWTSEAEAQHRFSLPGTYGVMLEVRDPGALTNQTVRTVSIADIAAPLIKHVAPDRVYVGQPIAILVQVTDSSANLNVTLRYVGVTDRGFTVLDMERAQDGTYQAVIPPQPTGGFLRYNFAAVDDSQNGRTSSTFTIYVTAQLSPSSMGTIALAGAGSVILAYWLVRKARPRLRRAERQGK